MRNVIPTFFTTNAEVIAIASNLMVFAALYQLSDGIQNVSVGILRGYSGREDHHADRLRLLLAAEPPGGLPVRFHDGHGSFGAFPGLLVRTVGRSWMMIVRIRRSIQPLHANGNSQSTIRNS